MTPPYSQQHRTEVFLSRSQGYNSLDRPTVMSQHRQSTQFLVCLHSLGSCDHNDSAVCCLVSCWIMITQPQAPVPSLLSPLWSLWSLENVKWQEIGVLFISHLVGPGWEKENITSVSRWCHLHEASVIRFIYLFILSAYNYEDMSL